MKPTRRWGWGVTCWRTAWQLPKEANVESRDLAAPRLRMRSRGLKTYCPHKAVNVHVHGDVIHNSQGGGNDPRVRYSLSVETRQTKGGGPVRWNGSWKWKETKFWFMLRCGALKRYAQGKKPGGT